LLLTTLVFSLFFLIHPSFITPKQQNSTYKHIQESHAVAGKPRDAAVNSDRYQQPVGQKQSEWETEKSLNIFGRRHCPQPILLRIMNIQAIQSAKVIHFGVSGKATRD